MHELRLDPRDFVEAHLYESEDAVVQDALEHLLRDRPDLRTALAVHLYDSPPGVTLARAAELADVSMEEMKGILVDRGVELRLGPATIEEARAEIEAARRLRHARSG